MRSKNLCRALVASAALLGAPIAAQAFVAVSVSVGFAPPALPVYVQPPCPAPGYMWTPGYWAYDPAGADYYWVPGTWVAAPYPGMLWTPGYWAFAGGIYGWHAGYWGPRVGFYGGVNYGFGYVGTGFVGGYWRGGAFFYNRSAANVAVSVTNVYRQPVPPVPPGVGHTSFNGGPGGIALQPTAEERAYAEQPHNEPSAEQQRHEEAARAQPALHASNNHGLPAVAATAHAGQFSGHGVVAAHGAAVAHHAAAHANAHPAHAAAHPGEPHAAHAPSHEAAREPAREPPRESGAQRHEHHGALGTARRFA